LKFNTKNIMLAKATITIARTTRSSVIGSNLSQR
jgi:hypothetical protein